LAEQLQGFTIHSLRAKRVRRFDPLGSLVGLRAANGKTIMAIDIGGGELSAAYFVVRDGDVRRTADIVALARDGGMGFLTALRQLSELAKRDRLPVGVSVAGPVDGTRLLAGPNLAAFVREFHAGFGGDFAALFDDVEVANDAEAGIMAGALEATRQVPDTRDVIYVINGSGLGGAVLTGGWIYATEPGHVELADKLNAFGQRRACGLGGAGYACIEAAAAGRSGVEDIWRQRGRRSQSGRDVSARYQAGDGLARDLYDASARLMAHVIWGMAEVFGLAADPGHLVVVGHGGIFHVPGYGGRVADILRAGASRSLRILYTKDFSRNTCLEGAAVAAATSTRNRA
jgi:predicted NBD/HSP70 family sugar kinase